MSNSTNIYEFPDAKGIVVSGDIHGDFTQLVFKVCVSKGLRDSLVIIAGDCGFGFNLPGYYDNIYQKCSKRLAKANNWIAFVRGNHDNPAYFDGQQVNYERWKGRAGLLRSESLWSYYPLCRWGCHHGEDLA